MSRSLVDRLVTVGCALVVIATLGVPAGTAAAGTQSGTTWAQTDDPPSNATPIRHEDPDSVAQSGNASALERRLSAALADRLSASARSIEAGEYETAQRLLAKGYDERLALYLDVYRTAVTSDLERVERQETLFAETAALQARYAARLSTYRQVEAEYEAARQDGDRERAQLRARELRNITGELQGIERSLTPRYEAIDGTTDGSVTVARTVISDTTAATTQRTAERVEATYTTTGVTVEASPTGSFADPVRITGRLTAADDDPPSGNVSFRVNGRTVPATVRPDGTFVLRYRPVTAAEGPTRTTVTYTPDDAALYLPAETTVSTTVAQSTPAVSIDDASARGRVGASVTAAGRVTVDDTPVRNTSVTLRIGERTLAETRTDSDGNYRFGTQLPANVSAGNRTLSVSVGRSGSALTPVREDTEVTVEPTPTRLTMSAVRSEGAVNVAGRLVTDTETGVAGEEVVVSLDGEQRATVRTDADGRYQTRIELSNSTNASSAVPVEAAFDGNGTSLNSTTVGAVLTPPGQGPLPSDTRTLTLALVAGIVAVTAGGFAIYRYRRDRGSSDAPPADAVHPTSTDPAVVAAPVGADVDGTEADTGPSGPTRTEGDP